MAGPKPPKRHGQQPSAPPAAQSQPPPAASSTAAHWIALFGRIAERFGIPFAVLCAIGFAVKLLGSEKTQDDFVREVLFGDVTKTRYLSLFFAVLVVCTVMGFSTWNFGRTGESNEMKRLAAEKGKLQEKVLGTTLSHSDPSRVGDMVAKPASEQSTPASTKIDGAEQ